MKYFIYTLLFACLVGCSTISKIEKNYASVNFSNGIGSEEALFIAKKRLLDSLVFKDWKVDQPELMRDRFVRSYPDHWFVQFSSKAYERSFWRYLIVIDRKTGEVLEPGAYVPLEVVDYDWVFSGKR